MKSKISIWDCRRAIEIKGGLPLTIRGALFAGPEPDPVANFLPKEVFVTQLEIKQGRWIIGNIGFTRYGQEYLTKLARTSLRTTIACMPRNNRTSTPRVRLTDPLPGLSAARQRPFRVWLACPRATWAEIILRDHATRA